MWETQQSTTTIWVWILPVILAWWLGDDLWNWLKITFIQRYTTFFSGNSLGNLRIWGGFQWVQGLKPPKLWCGTPSWNWRKRSSRQGCGGRGDRKHRRSHGPPARWMVYFMENPKITWMITRGSPILGNLHLTWKSTGGSTTCPRLVEDVFRGDLGPAFPMV